MDLSQTITLILATTGSVLGIVTGVVQLNQNRVRLRVTPKYAWSTGGIDSEEKMIAIEIVNLSTFAVTICETGFSLPHAKKITIIHPVLLDNRPWPRRLESREAVTVYCKLLDIEPHALGSARHAYAITDCGTVRKGTSKAFEDITKIAKGVGERAS